MMLFVENQHTNHITRFFLFLYVQCTCAFLYIILWERWFLMYIYYNSLYIASLHGVCSKFGFPCVALWHVVVYFNYMYIVSITYMFYFIVITHCASPHGFGVFYICMYLYFFMMTSKLLRSFSWSDFTWTLKHTCMYIRQWLDIGRFLKQQLTI
jgi:hypothetical protein